MKKLIHAFIFVLLVLSSLTLASAQDSVEVEIRNPVTIPGSPAQLQFDVYVRANNAGTFYGSLGVFLQFDQADLGSDPAVSATALSMISGAPASGAYVVRTPSKSGNVFNLTSDNNGAIFSFGPPSPFFTLTHIEIPTTFSPYLQVTIDYPGSTIVPTTIDLLRDDAPPTPYDNGIYTLATPGVTQYGFKYGTSSLTFGSLPVEWLGFSAERMEDTRIKLDWQTATETNNDYFEVQRSVDGQLFQSVGTVDGAGTSNQMSEYQFFDANYPSTRLFYRIKQVDLSGETHFSSIASVNIGEDAPKVAFFLYPSPAVDMVHAELLGETVESYRLVIVDQLGKTVYDAQMNEEISRLDIPVDRLANGIYNYQLTRGLDVIKQGRFMKVQQ